MGCATSCENCTAKKSVDNDTTKVISCVEESKETATYPFDMDTGTVSAKVNSCAEEKEEADLPLKESKETATYPFDMDIGTVSTKVNSCAEEKEEVDLQEGKKSNLQERKESDISLEVSRDNVIHSKFFLYEEDGVILCIDISSVIRWKRHVLPVEVSFTVDRIDTISECMEVDPYYFTQESKYQKNNKNQDFLDDGNSSLGPCDTLVGSETDELSDPLWWVPIFNEYKKIYEEDISILENNPKIIL